MLVKTGLTNKKKYLVFFSQSDAKPKRTLYWVRDFSRGLPPLQDTAESSDWLIAIFQLRGISSYYDMIEQMQLHKFKPIRKKLSSNVILLALLVIGYILLPSSVTLLCYAWLLGRYARRAHAQKSLTLARSTLFALDTLASSTSFTVTTVLRD